MRRREFGAGDPFGEAGRGDHLDRGDAAVCPSQRRAVTPTALVGTMMVTGRSG